MPVEDYAGYLYEYYSVMNYYWLFRDQTLFDFSDGSNGPPYDWKDWMHIYLPAFQRDETAYEEPIDESFEDFEIVEKNPWHYNPILKAELIIRNAGPLDPVDSAQNGQKEKLIHVGEYN